MDQQPVFISIFHLILAWIWFDLKVNMPCNRCINVSIKSFALFSHEHRINVFHVEGFVISVCRMWINRILEVCLRHLVAKQSNSFTPDAMLFLAREWIIELHFRVKVFLYLLIFNKLFLSESIKWLWHKHLSS